MRRPLSELKKLSVEHGGYRIRPKRNGAIPDIVIRIIDMHNSGMTYEEIGKELHMTRQGANFFLRKYATKI